MGKVMYLVDFNKYAFEYIDDSKEEFPNQNYQEIITLKNQHEVLNERKSILNDESFNLQRKFYAF